MYLRTDVFELDAVLDFPSAGDWSEKWKFIDNCWRKKSSTTLGTIFECRLNGLRQKCDSKSNGNIRRKGRYLRNPCCPAMMIVSARNSGVCVQKHGDWSSHSHTLDLMDQIRSCLFIREYIKNEAQRGYDLEAISNAFHKKFDSEGIGAIHVTRRRIRQYMGLSAKVSEEKIDGALTANGFRFFSKTVASMRLLLFANETQLHHLVKFGSNLLLMDACNLSSRYLVTLMVRDNLRSWVPAAQFWISHEHADLYEIALKTLCEWTNHNWNPSAFLIDGSSIEACATRRCFLRAKILRCTRHSTETIRTKLSHIEDIRYNMDRAIFAQSRAECNFYIQESLKLCPYADLKRYIQSTWSIETSHIWSMYSRLEVPILREVTTINPLESFHSLIRRHTNQKMNVKECTVQLLGLIKQRFEASSNVQLENEINISRVAQDTYPQLRDWTLPYQELVGNEIIKAKKMLADGSWKFQWFQPTPQFTCRCKFFRSKQLPCRHIFIKDLRESKNWIQQANWEGWSNVVEALCT